jgi:hypothetical protein
MSPVGVEEMVQPRSPAAKLVPWTGTFVPGRPPVSNNESVAFTMKLAVPRSVAGFPVRVTTQVPVVAVAATVNEPVMVPPVAVVQVTGAPPTGLPAPAPVTTEAGHVSVRLKPVPVKDIDAPLGPELGDKYSTSGITASGAEAEPGVPPPPATVIT